MQRLSRINIIIKLVRCAKKNVANVDQREHSLLDQSYLIDVP